MEEKVLISIVLAIYNPNLIWLQELLISLNQQTYSKLELIVCDDASENISLIELEKIIKKYILKFPFQITRNEKNIGSNQTFQNLINTVKGQYIAFCDQDDIWKSNKIEKLYQNLLKENAVLSYCDLQIIDAIGDVKYKNFKIYRKRLNYISGENLTEKYIFNDCTAGCTILVKKEVAIEAGDIPENTYWDHWICIIASIKGKISFVDKILLSYRIHDQNQSGVLAGIEKKEDYYRERVEGMFLRVKIISDRGYTYKNQKQVEAIAYARKEKKVYQMWKYRKLCKKEVYFEICMKFISEYWFLRVVTILKEKQ